MIIKAPDNGSWFSFGGPGFDSRWRLYYHIGKTRRHLRTCLSLIRRAHSVRKGALHGSSEHKPCRNPLGYRYTHLGEYGWQPQLKATTMGPVAKTIT